MERPEPTGIETEVTKVDVIVSRGDEKGDITYANPIFFKISGYSEEELLKQPHSILRHPDMPKVVFEIFWKKLQSNEEVYAFVKNLRKDGGHYWVFAHVRPALNPDGSFRNYVSTRKQISVSAKETIANVYKTLVEVEKAEGVDASRAKLAEILESYNGSLETFNDVMKSIQGN